MPYQPPTPQHGGMRPQHGGMPPQHGRMQRPVYSQQQYQGNTNFRPNMYQMRPRQHGPDQHRMPYQQYRPQHQPPVPRVPMRWKLCSYIIKFYMKMDFTISRNIVMKDVHLSFKPQPHRMVKHRHSNISSVFVRKILRTYWMNVTLLPYDDVTLCPESMLWKTEPPV